MPEPPAAPHDGERPRRAPPGDERTEPAAPGGVLGRWQRGWGWGGAEHTELGCGFGERGGARGRSLRLNAARPLRAALRSGGGPDAPSLHAGGVRAGPGTALCPPLPTPGSGVRQTLCDPLCAPPPPGQTACKAPCLCRKTAATPPALGQLCPLLAICPPHPREGPFAPPPARSLPPPPIYPGPGGGGGCGMRALSPGPRGG